MKSSYIIFITTVLGLVVSQMSPTTYDHYVLALQVPSTMCIKDYNCQNYIGNVAANTPTLHGLWPSLTGTNTDSYDCNQGSTVEITLSDNSTLLSNAEYYWGSLDGSDSSFWTHEYNKHGYCWMERYGHSNSDTFFNYVLNYYLNQGYQNIFQNGFDIQSGSDVG